MEMKMYPHAVGYNAHHIEWCTKRRYKMFSRPEFIKICEDAIRGAAARHNIVLRELSVLPDHVHCSAELPPTMSQSDAERLLKGGSAYEIFRAIPNFRKRYPKNSLWSRGKMAKSVGGTTIDVIDEYVRGQYEHHGVPNPAQTNILGFM